MLGSSLHDNFADLRAAGVKDMIKVVFQQCGGFIDGTIDNAEAMVVQILGEELGDQGRGVRGDLRGLAIHMSAAIRSALGSHVIPSR